MKRLKENKAITLVALVITIIILLILAGISIAQLSGNGLFEKAKLAKEVSKNAQDDEDDKIQQYGNEINNYVSGNRDDRITQLENRIQELENKSISLCYSVYKAVPQDYTVTENGLYLIYYSSYINNNSAISISVGNTEIAHSFNYSGSINSTGVSCTANLNQGDIIKFSASTYNSSIGENQCYIIKLN